MRNASLNFKYFKLTKRVQERKREREVDTNARAVGRYRTF